MKHLMDSHNLDVSSLSEFLLSGRKILIITGEVNSGKSIIAKKTVSLCEAFDKNICGNYSKGIFDNNDKIGFNIINIKTGEEKILARTDENEDFSVKQGQYYFNPKIFIEYNDKLINSINSDIILIDEIGPLELNGGGFYPAINNLVSNFKGKLIFVIRKSLLNGAINKFNLDIRNIFVLEENWFDNF